jgi:hypothetical protein
MKVIGLGAPDEVQIRFAATEIDVLVDLLREQRADATREAAETYAAAPPGETRAVDDRHDRLRAVEGLLLQLEEPPDDRPGAVLVGPTALMRDVVRDGARQAIRGLEEAHKRYAHHAIPNSGDALVNAAKTAKAWVATLTALDRVDRGWTSDARLLHPRPAWASEEPGARPISTRPAGEAAGRRRARQGGVRERAAGAPA